MGNPNPTCVVLGLGFEPDIALGLIEELEPAAVSIWRPTGHEADYSAKIAENNALLIEMLGGDDACVHYDVNDWYGLTNDLVLFLDRARDEFKPVIIPFGPKIFACSAIFSAICLGEEICVWRVSPVVFDEPIDRIPCGTVEFLGFRFGTKFSGDELFG